MSGDRIDPVFVHAGESAVFHRELDRGYPLIDRGEGMWLVDAGGNRYLDAVGGGAMVASLGAGAGDVIEAARSQLERIGFIYNQQFTSPARSSSRASSSRSRPASRACTSRAAAPRPMRPSCGWPAPITSSAGSPAAGM